MKKNLMMTVAMAAAMALCGETMMAATVTGRSAKTSLAGTEEIPINDAGVDKKVTVANLLLTAQGAMTATSFNGLTIDTTTGTLDLTNAKTLAVTNTLTLSGTDGTVMTFPSTSGTVVTLAGTQTLTNKILTSPTMTAPVLGVATATSVNGLTIDTTTGTLDITNAKTLGVTASVTLAGTDGTTMTFPGTSGTVVTLDATQTLTNKTLTAPTLTTPTLGVASATSVNKVAVTAPATSATLTLSDGSSLITSGGHSITLTSGGATNVTLPTTGTLATRAGAETFTNKTLTAAKLADLGFIADANGNELIIGDTVTSAVNEITVANAATGAAPSILGSGETNVNVLLAGKGTGKVRIGAGADRTKLWTWDLAGATTAKTRTIVSSHTDDRSNTVPDVAGTFEIAQASTTTALTADSQAVTPGKNTVLQLTSDNATATSRTFTLSATGAVAGQIYVIIGPATNACEIADTGIQRLSATWTPAAADTLTLLFDGTNFNELSRSDN